MESLETAESAAAAAKAVRRARRRNVGGGSCISYTFPGNIRWYGTREGTEENKGAATATAAAESALDQSNRECVRFSDAAEMEPR